MKINIFCFEDGFRLDNSTEDYSEGEHEKTARIFFKYHDNSVIAREFREGELVYAKTFHTGSRWKSGGLTRDREIECHMK